MDAWPPKKILSRLENQLFLILGSRPFSSLKPADFLPAIQKAEARGAIETAHRLAQLCGQVSRYARIVGHTRLIRPQALQKPSPQFRPITMPQSPTL
ncbi:phage integrase central domain-containing protein [Desulfovibrio sp.]|uniref:phage integrase central domain-containing protein n=1 Tax=Desulfovibrio sp. TaxID=885 RepID=UPI0039E497CF